MKNWIKNFFKTYKIAEYKTPNSTFYYIVEKSWFFGKSKLIKVFCNKEAADWYLKNKLL